ncbi:MAG: hypothetical protein K6T80_04455 [Firmicutes bacterium]|nr:hypothetical protein [Bacillota bacterium]
MILFVHGMGSHGKDFWRVWAGNLLPELSALGISVREENCGGVYYDDLVPRRAGLSEAEARALKEELKALAVFEFSRHSHRGLISNFKQAVRKWAEAVVSNFGDIFTYLYLEKTHRAVNERVYEALAAALEPVTLIGYSLGSLVAYCALKENLQAAGATGHLIMVGSPLFWFRHGVGEHAGFAGKPAAGRFTNIAGIWDIAWPQKVPELLAGLDESVEFVIDPLDPVSGHQKYFFQKKSLALIASAVAKGWLNGSRLTG